MFKKKEIGSDFRIPLSLIFKKKKNILSKNTILLSTGRDCLEYIIKSLKITKGHSILLPSYLCPEMITPFQKHGIQIKFYKVNKKLEINVIDFEKKIGEGKISIALIINYFGFIQPERNKIKDICKKNNVIFVEDIVQSFLSKEPIVGEIAFNSYRKSTHLPEGALLYGLPKQKLNHSLTHAFFVYSRTIAGLMKNISLLKLFYRPLFIIAEKKLIKKYNRPAGMSWFSKFLFQHLDINKIREKRQRNYSYLSDKLKHINKVKLMHQNITKNTFPFGLPILCENRNEVMKLLIKNKIYPPIHWKLPTEISTKNFPISYEISNKILTIPIDQRYNLKDMERVVKCIKS